ncbi:MAG: ligase-associated DNA damage response endonuclease PdeM [Ferruginibacter sp.]
MNAFLNFCFLHQNFLLTASRSIFWEEEKILILSDVHLGKSGHFRKSGIGVPQTIFKEDMQRLISQLQYFKPRQLLIVGDLFHSSANKEHDLFTKWRKDLPSIDVSLVKGNHDILRAAAYEQAGIDVYQEELKIGSFLFTHDINLCRSSELYCFSGHVHPAIRINGMSRQSITLPCFYFAKNHAILPAFGKFTGTYIIDPKPADHVFAVVENKIMQIQ